LLLLGRRMLSAFASAAQSFGRTNECSNGSP
jgi:hypothetical protein